MKRERKLNGFRVACKMAAAELELRKQEQDFTTGYACLERTTQCIKTANEQYINLQKLIDMGLINGRQQIQTWTQTMDWALAYALRMHGSSLNFAATYSMDVLGHRSRLLKQKNDRRARFLANQQQEDEEFESQEELDAWTAAELARAKSPELRERLESVRAQVVAELEAQKGQEYDGYEPPLYPKVVKNES